MILTRDRKLIYFIVFYRSKINLSLWRTSQMPRTMTKTQLTNELAQKTGINKKAVDHLLNELTAIAHREAANSFAIPGLGKLLVVNRKARMGRNPATGETIHIPAKRVLKFRISKACSEAVLGK